MEVRFLNFSHEPSGMTITLYHALYSTCSQKVRLTLAEKGLSWESRLVDLVGREQLAPWYLALNPNGVVPTIIDNGVAITDSSAICEYIEESQEGPNLSPSDPASRARMRAWMRHFEETPTAAIRVPSFNLAFMKQPVIVEAAARMREEATDYRRGFWRDMGTTGFSDALMEDALGKLRYSLRKVETGLADGGPYILGMLTLADLLFLPTVVRMEDIGLSHMWADLPQVSRWYGLMQARPSFTAAFGPGARLTS